MGIFSTDIHCTAFVSQDISSFGEVCLVRYRDHERGKQIYDYCYTEHKLGQEAKKHTFYQTNQKYHTRGRTLLLRAAIYPKFKVFRVWVKL